jgi:hypothetical protein
MQSLSIFDTSFSAIKPTFCHPVEDPFDSILRVILSKAKNPEPTRDRTGSFASPRRSSGVAREYLRMTGKGGSVSFRKI